jgi:hypothetical protein
LLSPFPEGKWTEHIHAPVPESMVSMRESRTSPDKITDLTMSSTPIINREQLYRKGISSTIFNVPREAKATMSPSHSIMKTKLSNQRIIIHKISLFLQLP